MTDKQNNKKIAVALTFNEVISLYNFVKKKMENNDYGFAPVVQILFDTPDEEFEEYQKIEVCCVHDITKEYMQAKEKNRKPDFKSIYQNITDTEKADFI